MKTHKFLLIIGLLLCILIANAQISTNELPITKSLKQVIELSNNATAKKIMPAINMTTIQQQDLTDEANGIPPRFGFPHAVSYNLNNSGQWTTLENGDKIWQLEISCPDALSINLLYDQFWLPEGTKLFIHNANKTKSIGAFTSLNNKGTESNLRGFATGLVYGNKVTLEYYVPSYQSKHGIISIAYVVQGYRYIRLPESTEIFGGSGNCQVNINCSEGQSWQMEKNAVALILVNGSRWCSGSLINTTANDNRPHFLTANHCLNGNDAITSPNLDHYSFYWNYETPDCSNISTEPEIKSTAGAIILANNATSDFALLNLTEDPILDPSIRTYYLGWDRSGNTGTGGVGIHHPSGDVKKIATHNQIPTNSGNFWNLYWMQTTNGYSVTEGGSSGSPLINNNHKVIGQLYGGSTVNCSNPANDLGRYGKFSISWTGNNNPDNRRRLSHWLDPLNTDVATLDGIREILPVDLLIRDDLQDYGTEPNPRTINWNSPDIKLLYYDNDNEIPFGQIGNELVCRIAVNVKNIGNETSSGNGKERLHIFWRKSGLISLKRFPWLHHTGFHLPIGGKITQTNGFPIPYSLQPNQEMAVAKYLFELPDNTPFLTVVEESFKIRRHFNWGFSIMAIADEGEGIIPELANISVYSNWGALAKKYNSIAVTNGNRLLIARDYGQIVEIMPAMNTPFSIRVTQLLKNGQYKLNDFAELNVLLSDNLIAKLDFQKSGVKQIDENTVYLPSADTELIFNPLSDEESPYFAGTEVHFISDKLPELNDFDFDFSLVTEGVIDETMRITAIRNADVYFKAQAEASKTKVVRAKEEVTLTSNQIFDDAYYTWYDEAGEKIGTGYQITLIPAVSQKYKIEILKKEDGFKSYDEVEVIVVDGKITSLSPNPARDVLSIEYKLSDNATSAYVQLSDIQNVVSLSVPIYTTANSQTISTSGVTPGSYIVKLVIGGAIVDTKNLIIY